MQSRRRLLRNYTQNIDGLESPAGVNASKIIRCHGTLGSLTCQTCGKKQRAAARLQALQGGRVLHCGQTYPARGKRAAAKAVVASSSLLPERSKSRENSEAKGGDHAARTGPPNGPSMDVLPPPQRIPIVRSQSAPVATSMPPSPVALQAAFNSATDIDTIGFHAIASSGLQMNGVDGGAVASSSIDQLPVPSSSMASSATDATSSSTKLWEPIAPSVPSGKANGTSRFESRKHDDSQATASVESYPSTSPPRIAPTRTCKGVLKPDITFFFEALPTSFEKHAAKDLAAADLYVVIGSSMRVAPVANMASFLRPECPRILINLESVVPKGGEHFDAVLLGDCQETVQALLALLQWDLPPMPDKPAITNE